MKIGLDDVVEFIRKEASCADILTIEEELSERDAFARWYISDNMLFEKWVEFSLINVTADRNTQKHLAIKFMEMDQEGELNE